VSTSTDTVAAASSVTKAEFIKQADAICKQTNVEIQQVTKKLSGAAASPKIIERGIVEFEKVVTKNYAMIAKLDRPVEDAAQIDTFLKQAQNAIDALKPVIQVTKKLQTAVESRDVTQLTELQTELQKSQKQLTATEEALRKSAKEYGFKVCESENQGSLSPK